MICLGVVGSCSSPRMTWEIAMVRSSTALASTKSGLPLPLTQMKSSMARCGNSTSPRTRSCTSYHAVIGRAETQGPPAPREQPEVAAVPVVAGRGVAGRRALPGPGVDLLPGAGARIERAAGPQVLDGLGVDRALGRLEVGTLVGRHAQPVQRRDDPVGPLGAVALLVGVLNAQDERARRAGARTAS